MTLVEIENEVMRIVAELPDEMRTPLAEVVFIIADEPDEATRAEAGLDADDDLLGFYRGIPLPDRTTDMQGDLPDTIYLFRKAILREARQTDAVVHQIVRETALHEIAHFFGYEDEDLEAMGVY